MEGTTTKPAPNDDAQDPPRGDTKHDAERNERTLIVQDKENEPVLDRPRADETRRLQDEDAPEIERQPDLTRDLLASS